MSNNSEKKSAPKLIRSAAIVLFITIILLATIEGALRVLPVELEQKGIHIPDNFILTGLACEFHPEYLIKLKANLTKRYVRSKINGGREILWKTNSLGLRGPELRENPELRVVVYGDSNIQARFSELKDTFPKKLEDELTGRLKRDVEVLNAGVLGFGPDQSYLKFKEEAGALKPDLVVFHFFADNDFSDAIRNRIFDLDQNGRLTRSTHEKTPDIVLTEKGFIAKLAITKYIKLKKTKKQEQKSFVTEKISINKRADEEYEVFWEGAPREYSHFNDHYDWRVSFQPESKDAMINVMLVEEIFKEASVFAENSGIRFMVLIEPSARDMTENHEHNHKLFASYPGYNPRNLTDFAEDVLKRNNIPGLNLYDLYSRNNPRELFFINNDHWNDKGQALAASATASYIIENGLMK